MCRSFKWVIASRMTDALSSCDRDEHGIGNALASSQNISVSWLRRQRAASRDFSFRCSEFLFITEKKYVTLARLPYWRSSRYIWPNFFDEYKSISQQLKEVIAQKTNSGNSVTMPCTNLVSILAVRMKWNNKSLSDVTHNHSYIIIAGQNDSAPDVTSL